MHALSKETLYCTYYQSNPTISFYCLFRLVFLYFIALCKLRSNLFQPRVLPTAGTHKQSTNALSECFYEHQDYNNKLINLKKTYVVKSIVIKTLPVSLQTLFLAPWHPSGTEFLCALEKRQKLWWLRDSGYAEDRQVISADSAFDTTGITTLLLSAGTSRKK